MRERVLSRRKRLRDEKLMAKHHKIVSAMAKELREEFPDIGEGLDEEDMLRKEERLLVTSANKGETFEDVLWRERLARLVECYSNVQSWELDLLTGVKPQPNKHTREQFRNARLRKRQKALVAVQIEKTCARWLGHNELMSK
jgi:hypothetical protein